MYEAIPKAIIGHLVNIFALGLFYGHIENAKIVVAIFLVTMDVYLDIRHSTPTKSKL